MPTRRGSIKIFQLLGINVYVHWSWFFFGIFRYYYLPERYTSPAWYAAEYVALFLIVLTHEFGHALACRQVGGRAREIVLWPLGGVAYVSPPQRPGATLWSIAAGPLVNVALTPLLGLLFYLSTRAGWAQTMPNGYLLIASLFEINTVMLLFNLLPVFPLDGGQILWSLLWFVFGRARSLMVATVAGFVGVAALMGVAWLLHSGMLFALTLFVLINCWQGFLYARALLRLEAAPRRTEFACPVCQAPPPAGPFWRCARCRRPFDTFASGATCPHCGTHFNTTACAECGNSRPMEEWSTRPVIPTVAIQPLPETKKPPEDGRL
jgi:Zn-dependent protease